ncbi:MAG: response regulator [bacterium]|nr:response regulator [bacterium]
MDKKMKLLIIDDENVVLQSSLRILRDKGFEIDTASTGEEGLEKTEEKKYDIVITDLMMPGIGGMDVLKILREKQPDVSVIIFTGFATVETAREALKLGAFDYIPKPFTPEEFRSVVDNAVQSCAGNEDDSEMLDLMAIVSHDLKSPISVVHTSAETLYKGYFGDLDPKQMKTIEAILRNCQYLEDIIRTYLDLSKMGLDGIGSFKEKIDLAEVINTVINVPETQSNIKNMSIVTDFQETPMTFADPHLLNIVLTNLVSNAVKYGKKDTTIKVSLVKKDDSYMVSIFNEGVGLSPDDIENKLFKKYSRLKQKGTEGIKGNGLGLYICKTIIEKHSGKIWAESKEGEWVRFCFTIPA